MSSAFNSLSSSNQDFMSNIMSSKKNNMLPVVIFVLSGVGFFFYKMSSTNYDVMQSLNDVSFLAFVVGVGLTWYVCNNNNVNAGWVLLALFLLYIVFVYTSNNSTNMKELAVAFPQDGTGTGTGVGANVAGTQLGNRGNMKMPSPIPAPSQMLGNKLVSEPSVVTAPVMESRGNMMGDINRDSCMTSTDDNEGTLYANARMQRNAAAERAFDPAMQQNEAEARSMWLGENANGFSEQLGPMVNSQCGHPTDQAWPGKPEDFPRKELLPLNDVELNKIPQAYDSCQVDNVLYTPDARLRQYATNTKTTRPMFPLEKEDKPLSGFDPGMMNYYPTDYNNANIPDVNENNSV
jgi:hypothetical protein